MNADKSLMPLARAAERRLGRLHVWAAIRQRVTWMAGAAAAGAVLRPFVWPLHHQAPLLSAERALAFAGASALLVTTVIVARAWRSRPSLLSATRRIDQALGLSEVVASGVAFEQAKRDDEMAAFAITRAHEASKGAQPKKLFRSEPVSQPRFFRLMIAAAAAGILFGAVDRLVVERAMHPVTSSEKSAAEGLKNAAAQLGKTSKEATKEELAQPSPNEQAMAEAAKRAAEAAERGDRQGAMEALEDMKKAERALQAEERDRSKSLRALRDELTAQENKAHAATASEALADLEQQLSEKPSPEDLDNLAERLDKAEQAAREAAKNAGSEAEKAAWNRAADALKEAKEAAQRGDAAAAKKALEKAEKEMAGLENKSKSVSGKNSAVSKMSEQAAKLDRSLRAGAEGKPSAGEGDDKGKGKGEGDKGKGGSPSKGGPDDKDKGKNPGPGGGGPGDRDPLKDPKRLKLNGDLQARTDVREGEKAVSAIEGMGKGGDPKAYQEIFPAYDTVVEDGLREDNVPAARRTTVRRYFKSIRPGEEESK